MSTTKEKIEHLINGGGLKSQSGIKKLGDDGQVYCNGVLQSSVIDFDDSEIYHDPKWYENIQTQGVLCFVGDSIETMKNNIYVVAKYDKSIYLPFKAQNGVVWKYAEPLTKEEVMQYILDTPK